MGVISVGERIFIDPKVILFQLLQYYMEVIFYLESTNG